MNFIEFIGFFFSMLLMIWLMGRRATEERKRRREEPEKETRTDLRRQKEQLKEILKTLNLELEEEEDEDVYVPPQPPPAKKVSPPPSTKSKPARMGSEFKTSFANYETHTNIEDRRIPVHVTDKTIDVYTQPIVSLDMSFGDQQAYEIVQKVEESRVRDKIDTLPSLRDMVVFHEILDAPKGLRNIDAHEAFSHES